MTATPLFQYFSALPAVRDLPAAPAQAILALRYAILCRRLGQDPLPELERRWGHSAAARRFTVLVEVIGTMWPEPFAVAPPCCQKLSFDEALLADMVTSARIDDRRRFDLQSAEMFGSDARDMLFSCLRNFIHAEPLTYNPLI